jgi:hypothetical protein
VPDSYLDAALMAVGELGLVDTDLDAVDRRSAVR